MFLPGPLDRARTQGQQLGRPRVPATKEAAIRAARAEGKGVRRIARELNVGVSVVQRVIGAGSGPGVTSEGSAVVA